jgi:hypothetical protein
VVIVLFVSWSLPSIGSICHSIINVHKPVEGKPEDGEDAFYDDLGKLRGKGKKVKLSVCLTN